MTEKEFFAKKQLNVSIGKRDTMWHRIKQLVRWIIKGEATFKV